MECGCQGADVCPTKSVTDHELLRQYAATGSGEAFGTLVERHSALVFSVCYRVLMDRQWAEDATQAVFLILMKKPCASPEFNLPGWLHGCAVRMALKIKRAQYRRALRERIVPMANPSDESALELWNEIKPHVDTALAALPAVQRDAIVLRYFNGLTEVQAAKTVGCSTATLHSRVRLGLARLRERLKRYNLTASASALQMALAIAPIEHPPAALTETIKSICSGKCVPSPAASKLARAAQGSTTTVAKQLCASLVLLSACTITILAFRNQPVGNSAPANTDYALTNKTIWSFEKAHVQKIPVMLRGVSACAFRISPDQIHVPGKAMAQFTSLPTNFRLEYDFQIEAGRDEIICFTQGLGVYTKGDQISRTEYKKGIWYHWAMEMQRAPNTAGATGSPAPQIVKYSLDGKLVIKGEVEKFLKTITLEFDTATVLISNFTVTDLDKNRE